MSTEVPTKRGPHDLERCRMLLAHLRADKARIDTKITGLEADIAAVERTLNVVEREQCQSSTLGATAGRSAG